MRNILTIRAGRCRLPFPIHPGLKIQPYQLNFLDRLILSQVSEACHDPVP